MKIFLTTTEGERIEKDIKSFSIHVDDIIIGNNTNFNDQFVLSIGHYASNCSAVCIYKNVIKIRDWWGNLVQEINYKIEKWEDTDESKQPCKLR